MNGITNNTGRGGEGIFWTAISCTFPLSIIKQNNADFGGGIFSLPIYAQKNTAKLACKHGCCNSRIYHRLFFHHGRIRGFVCCVNTAPYGPNLDAFFTCSYGCPYDDPVPTRQTHRTAREKPFRRPVLARKNNRHAAAPVPVMHRSKPSLAT